MHRDTHLSSGMQISCGNGNCCPHGLIFSSSNRVAETYFKIHPMGLRSIRNTCRPELCFLLPEVMLWLYLQGSNWTRTHGPRERNGVSVMFFERLERRSNSFLAVRHWTAIVIPIPPVRPSVCRMRQKVAARHMVSLCYRVRNKMRWASLKAFSMWVQIAIGNRPLPWEIITLI